MTLENCKKNSRSKATFYKHGLENERFVLWLYHNEKYRSECLPIKLVEDFDDITASNVIPARLLKVWSYLTPERRKERKHKNQFNKLRRHMRTWTGKGGEPPSQQVVLFSGITLDCFGSYICEKQKAYGGLLKPGGYKAMRSGLSYLFRRYSRKMAIRL